MPALRSMGCFCRMTRLFHSGQCIRLCRARSHKARWPAMGRSPNLFNQRRGCRYAYETEGDHYMAGLTGALTSIVVSKLTAASDGVNVRVAAITHSDASLLGEGIRTVIAQHANVEISEKTGHAHYPALLVYCDKVSNTLKEKFRQFSGKV